MAQALALCPQLVLAARFEPFGVGRQRSELVESSLSRRRVARQLFVRAARRLQLAPGTPCRAHRLAGLGERVEHGELVARPPEPALLELAAHREQSLGGGGDVFAGGAPSPCVRARAPVGKDPAREHERLLALGPQLRQLAERFVVGQVELRLHVRLAGRSSDRRRVAARAEQQPEGVREDRLARAGLARDRIQAGVELELGLANQHEVLDPEASQHAAPSYGGRLTAPTGLF